MKSEKSSSIPIIFPETKLDITNVAKTEEYIKKNLQKTNFCGNIILDAESLNSITSAGLRLILKLKKEYSDISIINVSPEVFDVFKMSGFTEMLDIQKLLRQVDVSKSEVIGRGSRGTVYRYDNDTVVKVYDSKISLEEIKKERMLARNALMLGIPTAISYDIVKVGDKFGSVFELVNSKSYSMLISDDINNRDKYISEYTLLLNKIHSTKVYADVVPNIKIFVFSWLESAKECLSESTYNKIFSLIKNVPDTMNLLHCDYHTGNVLRQKDGPCIIDMDTLSHGHPIFELANIYSSFVGFGEFDEKVVEDFLGISYSLANEIWQKFIKLYLSTEDEKFIFEVEQKAKIISNLRMIKRLVKNENKMSLCEKNAVTVLSNELDELTEKYKTLEF